MTFILTDLPSLASLRVMFFLQARTFLTLMTNCNHHEDGRFYQAGRRKKDGENDADSALIALFCDGIASALLQK